MKKRNYIKVSYRCEGKRRSDNLIMSEVRLINTVLKELADDEKCEVELMECTQTEYNLLF